MHPCHPPCPHCGQASPVRNPFPTVDIVIYQPSRGILLIRRGNPPWGWALPGGFIDYGESAEQAAVREAREETGLDVSLTRLLGVYSKPERDPRFHTLSVVFVAEASPLAQPCAGDDAREAQFFSFAALPDMAFDHRLIVDDFIRQRGGNI